MTTQRTNGPCSVECQRRSTALGKHIGHQPDCPALYPAQQEPDALTKLAHIIRALEPYTNHEKATELMEQSLALVSEAREEQRKRDVLARSDGLGRAARIAHDVARKANGYPERHKAALDIATLILEAKEEP